MKINIGKLAVKFGLTLAAAVISFTVLEANPLPLVLMLALIVTLVNYFFVDMFLQRHLGNILAGVIKGVLAVLIAWFFGGSIFPDFTITAPAQIAFGLLTGGLEATFG